jgi:hypothetical protein
MLLSKAIPRTPVLWFGDADNSNPDEPMRLVLAIPHDAGSHLHLWEHCPSLSLQDIGGVDKMLAPSRETVKI